MANKLVQLKDGSDNLFPQSISKNIYRFYLADGAVAANGIPAISKSYAADNLFEISNGKIISHYAGTVQIAVHIAAGTSNRLWYKVFGGNLYPQQLVYGSYASADSVQIAQVSDGTEIYVQFLEAANLGQGGLGTSYIFITILD